MFEDTVLLIDKPLHWSSFDVIRKLRNLLNIRKIGHAGTLDPLATGLLILCTGKKTKEISTFQEMSKVYEGSLVLGKTTPSFDLETDFDSQADWHHLSPDMVHKASQTFLGKINQIPPIYSAIKVKGKPLYLRARKGEKVTLAPRSVEVYSLQLPKITLPTVTFRIHCSKGLYIRSLVHDLGQQLGVGAFLQSLRRTKIGHHHLKEAYTIEQLTMLTQQSSPKSPA